MEARPEARTHVAGTRRVPCPRRIPMRPVRHAFAFFLALAVASPALAQTTWFVDASAVPPGNGTPASPYTSIQHAHDQATTLSGDTLSIAPGDYPEFLFFAQGKALTL